MLPRRDRVPLGNESRKSWFHMQIDARGIGPSKSRGRRKTKMVDRRFVLAANAITGVLNLAAAFH